MKRLGRTASDVERREMAKQMMLAGLSGLLLILAFPRFDLSFLAFFALVPLLIALYRAKPWKAFRLGLLSGCLFYLGSLFWITHTMTVYGGLPLLASTLILLGLALYLALYFALFALLYTRVQSHSGPFQVFFAAAAWTALEYLRTYLLTGFPWNLLGYSQYQNLAIIQVAAVTGVYGISFMIVSINATIAHFLRRPLHFKAAFFSSLVPILFLVTALGYSNVVLPWQSDGKMLRVTLLQGNIDQGVKWNPTYQAATVETYRRLTLQAVKERTALVVWPETAAPFFLRSDPGGEQVFRLAKQAGTFFLVGSPDWKGESQQQYFNSAFLISPEGRPVEKYDKIHLVPFGEYVPLKQILFFVQKMAYGIGDFGSGERYTIFSIPEGRFGVTICYEAIFPNQVRHYVKEGAEFLVNITNDAWFGKSAAPYQHLAMAALRAVENRIYLVRAANTGITAIVSPVGQILSQTDLFVEATLAGSIHPRKGETFYTRYGNVFAWFCLVFSLVALIGFQRHPSNRVTCNRKSFLWATVGRGLVTPKRGKEKLWTRS